MSYVHPEMDTSVLTAMGAIVSHAYLVAGVLPVRVAYPGLAKCLLGIASDIPPWVLTEAFVDSLITPHEAEVLKKALEEVKRELPVFSHDVMLDLLFVLSRFNIRQAVKFKEMLTQVAPYEFVSKPSAALSIMNAGAPVQHRPFWEGLGVDGLYEIYQAQCLSEYSAENAVGMDPKQSAHSEVPAAICMFHGFRCIEKVLAVCYW